MTEAQRRAYVADSRDLMTELFCRETWPLYPALKDVQITSLEVMEPDGCISFAWTATEDKA